jgi:hypothetical protein
VSLESDRTSYAGIKEEIEWLRKLGYDRFQTIEQSAVHTLQKPPNPPREGRYVEHQFIEGATGLFGEELEGEWLSIRQVLRRYRFIRLGYWLLDSDGIMNRYRILRSWKLQNLTRRIIERCTKGNASGWYDTHARLGS